MTDNQQTDLSLPYDSTFTTVAFPPLTDFIASRDDLLVEGNPIGAVAGFLGHGMDLVDLAGSVAPPGVIPARAHIQIQGMERLELLEQADKPLILHLVTAIDDAQAAILLAQGAIVGHLVVTPQGTDALAVMDDDGLTKTHTARCSHAVEQFGVLAVDKLPRRVAKPGKRTAVVLAGSALVALAATHVVTIDIAVGKLVEQLVCKRGLGTEDDTRVLL